MKTRKKSSRGSAGESFRQARRKTRQGLDGICSVGLFIVSYFAAGKKQISASPPCYFFADCIYYEGFLFTDCTRRPFREPIHQVVRKKTVDRPDRRRTRRRHRAGNRRAEGNPAAGHFRQAVCRRPERHRADSRLRPRPQRHGAGHFPRERVYAPSHRALHDRHILRRAGCGGRVIPVPDGAEALRRQRKPDAAQRHHRSAEKPAAVRGGQSGKRHYQGELHQHPGVGNPVRHRSPPTSRKA